VFPSKPPFSLCHSCHMSLCNVQAWSSQHVASIFSSGSRASYQYCLAVDDKESSIRDRHADAYGNKVI
jgi:hypothetical protein